MNLLPLAYLRFAKRVILFRHAYLPLTVEGLCLIVILLSVHIQNIKAQPVPSLDSLFEALETQPENTKVETSYRIIMLHFRNQNADSVQAAAIRLLADPVLSKHEFKDSVTGQIYRQWAITKYYLGQAGAVDSLARKAEGAFKRGNYKVGLAGSYSLQSGAASLQQKHEKSIEMLYKALRIHEELDNKPSIARTLGNLSSLLSEAGRHEEAYSEAEKALEIYKSIGIEDPPGLYITMGLALQESGKVDDALELYEKGLKIAEERQNAVIAGVLKTNIASLYSMKGENRKALKLYSDLEKERRGKASPLQYATALGGMAECYAAMNMKAEALECIEKVRAQNDTSQVLAFSKLFNGISARVYQDLGQYDSAFFYLEALHLTLAKIERENSEKAMAEARVSFETEKKEKENKILRQKDALQSSEIEKQRIIVAASLLGLLLVAGLLAFVYRNSMLRKRTNKVLQEKNNEINHKNTELQHQKEEILTQNEELQQQQEEINTINERLEEQFKEVQSQNLAINDSIRYAQTIQEAVLPHIPRLKKKFQDSFVLYKPQHIVSGDFFWFRSFKDYKLIAVGDCTGHGVPGAFMSLLGMSFLDHILTQFDRHEPDLMLEEINRLITSNLRQEHTGNQDGMELIICRIEDEEIIFSASKRSLFVVEEEQELKEYKGTRRYIGNTKAVTQKKSFERSIIRRSPGMMLYLSSDGFQDQLNNERKRFGSRAFKTLLQDIAAQPGFDQREALKTSFSEHRQDVKQVDDVTVLGIRL